jgi:quercetin 2,3-dioxygenase
VRVIAGESHGVKGAVTRATTEPLYLDISLPAGVTFEQAVPATHNAFIYVHGGAVEVEGTRVDSERMAILVNDAAADGVRIRALDEAAKVLLIAGRPLNEPIAQYGPFVMNTQQEIFQAVKDFQSGVLAT